MSKSETAFYLLQQSQILSVLGVHQSQKQWGEEFSLSWPDKKMDSPGGIQEAEEAQGFSFALQMAMQSSEYLPYGIFQNLIGVFITLMK